MPRLLSTIDRALLRWDKKHIALAARIVLAILFVWFGFLKVIHQSPAADLVEQLLTRTLPTVPFAVFFPWFGALEVLIGLLFLVPAWTRIAILLLVLHLVTTALPIVLLPDQTWQSPGILTLEGQYIVKNIAVGVLAMTLGLTLKPLRR